MKRIVPVLFLLACTPEPTSRVPEPTPAAGAFAVHEWGTFTSMHGSDGGGLEGLHREEEPLPAFVYSRSEVRSCPFRESGYKGLEVPVTHVTQKMETPVLYFHSDVPRDVRVRVDFVDGLISQWFPVSDLMGPPELEVTEGPLDLGTIDRSFLQWDITVLAPNAARPEEVPAVSRTNPWSFAREVDANWVRTKPRDWTGGRWGPVEAERYLFYRGLGTFTLPVKVQAEDNGFATLANGGVYALPMAVALQVEGERARFADLGAIPAGSSQHYDLGDAPWMDKDTAVDQLKDVVRGHLVAQRLHSDEATAMVRTWARSWFASQGSRVMYIVPRPMTDAILPLHIDPAPTELVRVLVGRLEYITPEREQQVVRDLAELANPERRDAAMDRLERLDRFLEPHVRAALRRSDDPEVQRMGAQLLATLTPIAADHTECGAMAR